ncbi:MAG: N-acetylneuraminate synthase family protein [Nitrospinota bacterium]
MSTKTLWIGDRPVGEDHPCFVIAEVGVNHNGQLKLALELIDVAVEAKADAVKFQKRSLEHLYQKEILQDPNRAEQAFQYLIPLLREMELSDEDYHTIVEHCRQKGTTFLCSPWDLPSVDFLETLAVPAYKIASADLTNFPLLEHVVDKGKPILLSTGMSSLEEIATTVAFLKKHQAEFALLHCHSTYPAPFEEVNLRFMETLREFGVPVGYSGHERGIAISTVASALGACIIERHITLDRTMVGPDHAASLEPHGFKKMVRDIRQAEVAMGRPRKVLSTMELLNRKLLGKSLVAAQDIPAGTLITREMVTAKGPGKGLSPQRLYDLVGRSAIRFIAQDEYFKDEDIGIDHTVQAAKGFATPWGFKTRFHDVDHFVQYEPTLVEFHFSDGDLGQEITLAHESYPQELYVHAPEVWFRSLVDLCAVNDEHREQSIRVIQATIDKTLELATRFRGTPKLVLHVGGMSVDPIDDASVLLENALDSIRRLDLAGVELLPENLPPRPWYLGGQWYQNAFVQPEEIVDFAKELGVGLTFDLCHAQLYCNMTGVPVAHYIKTILPYSRHLHISDAYGIDGEGIQVGEGEIDFEEAFRLLAKGRFSWVPEIWSGHEEGGRGFLIALERLAPYVR